MDNLNEKVLTKHVFAFSRGSYVVENSDPSKDKVLNALDELRTLVVANLPHRRQQVDAFIIACVDEILATK